MPSLQTSFFGLLLALICPVITFGQILNKDGSIDCTEPTVIGVTKGQIQMTSSGEYEVAVAGKDPVVFYKESDKYTFWYKIVVSHNCDLQFDIYPSDRGDRYNFFLYKYEGANFCKGIIDRTVTPFRANLFDRVGNEGVVGVSNRVKGERMEGVNEEHYFYYRPRQQVIEAHSGDVYYLNVHHLVGDDCGHAIEFSSCEKSLRIEAKHKPCYEPKVDPESVLEALEKLKGITGIASISSQSIEELELEDLPLVANEEVEQIPAKNQEQDQTQSVVLNPFAYDARSKKSLHMDLKISESETGKLITHRVNKDGGIEAEFSANTDYTIEYSSLGYQSTQMELHTGIDEQEFVLDPVYLDPRAVGSNIVLNNIYFHPNTYVFRNGGEQELERLLNFLRDNDQARIEIQGHTNGDYRVKSKSQYAHLSKAWNFRGSSQKLSRLRAGEVRDYLTGRGIDPDRLLVVGLGGKQMIIPDPHDYEDRLVNMRVEIVILVI